MEKVETPEFLQRPGVLFDVRSPSEHLHGHIPGSVSFPLFNDEERALVGTTYKQKSREQALELGINLVGPRCGELVRTAKALLSQTQNPTAKVHCWRGGMRSGFIAQLLEWAGIKAITLSGGYKTFRHWVLATIAQPLRLFVIGGLTGSGKTRILHALQRRGEQILDLEALAVHRGSAYGNIPGKPQPTTEQFENELAMACHALDPIRPVWVEGESRMIGHCKIPDAFFAAMQAAPYFQVQRPLQERLEVIQGDYNTLPAEHLIDATRRIEKQLGPERTQEVIRAIQDNLFHGKGKAPDFFVESVLAYYDKTYAHTIGRRHKPPIPVEGIGWSEEVWAEKLVTISLGL